MRFSALVLSGAFAMAAAQTTMATAASTTVSLTPAQESQAACLKTCKGGDVNCQAHCVGVPNPDDSQVNANTKCASECPQGDGSPAQTDKFAACLDKCKNQHYFTSGGTPKATPVADGGAGSSGAAGGASQTAGGALATDSAAVSSAIASASAAVSSVAASVSSIAGSISSAASSAAASATGGSGSSASSTSTSKGLAPAATAAPVAIIGLVAAVLAL